VPYLIQTAQTVEDYIRAIDGLSDSSKKAVIDGYLSDLAELADQFLAQFPVERESYLFEYDYAIIDGGLLYSFRFIVDGSHMSMGIVQVIYVDYESLPVPR
jgi:hypothetical protein